MNRAKILLPSLQVIESQEKLGEGNSNAVYPCTATVVQGAKSKQIDMALRVPIAMDGWIEEQVQNELRIRAALLNVAGLQLVPTFRLYRDPESGTPCILTTDLSRGGAVDVKSPTDLTESYNFPNLPQPNKWWKPENTQPINDVQTLVRAALRYAQECSRVGLFYKTADALMFLRSKEGANASVLLADYKHVRKAGALEQSIECTRWALIAAAPFLGISATTIEASVEKERSSSYFQTGTSNENVRNILL